MEKRERIQLSDHFNYRRLLKFVLPPIVMMIFTSVYSIVDGFFVSYFDSGLPFAALNIIFPLIMIVASIGCMFGSGGSAVVAKQLGLGNEKRAKEIFSMVVYTTIIVGAVASVLGICVCRPVSELLCKSEKNLTPEERALMVEYCVKYGRIILTAMPAFMLQNVFQSFFVTAEKPRLGLYVILAAGCTNILLDALLVPFFGLVGAATATAISQTLGGVIPLFYFFRKNDSLLRLGKCKIELRVLGGICINGSSELMSNVSASVVALLFNAQLMKFMGYKGVSAYGIVMYIGFIFIAIFLGYAIGSAPIVGYNYGAQNEKELKNIFKKSMILMTCWGGVMTLVSILSAKLFAGAFSHGDSELHQIATHAMRVYSFSFLFCGINIFASAFFTALSNGGVSALLSFLRMFLFQAVCVLVLPIFFKEEGIWASVVVAEAMAAITSFICFFALKKRYRYL